MNLFKFIKTLFSNHLIRKTYNGKYQNQQGVEAAKVDRD